ncbi:unknown [Bacteroides pectinophilus CAG:437]|uniref:Uncharacterized protein n=1 Tax=Bacteroides pectinophilus CAG:437 TaxID=1263051 RepID=R7AJY2_9FIRM|nr:unknown [Bacteroides pectinophilus CAG:437]
MSSGRNMEAESSILKGYDGRYDMADMVIST